MFDKIRKVLNDNGFGFAELVEVNYTNRTEYFVCLGEEYNIKKVDRITDLLTGRTDDVTVCVDVV